MTNPAEVTSPASPLTGRAAIVHDWFQGYHGAERVVDVMRTGLFAQGSEPDIYTFMAARQLLPPELADSIVRESRLASLPGIRQRGHDPGRWRYLLPYMPHYFRSLDLDDYDIVISSSHACATHVRPRPDAFHAVYCYTPMRYAWMPETDQREVGRLSGMVFDRFRAWLRKVDREAAQRPDLYLAISTAVQERIRRFYGRESVVVGAPVDAEDISHTQPKDESMFLWVHRLVPYKRPELVLEAFRDLPYKLTMVGIGPLEQTIRERLPPNVELLTWVSRETLVRLYERASGFIHVGEEDFGITMVEALAAGTPVIALNTGGARDIVRDGTDGILIDEADLRVVRDAAERVVVTQWNRDELASRARQFSSESFVARTLGALRHLASDETDHVRTSTP
ncbi:MAG: glycosyltransferase [Actinomycetota bacterium]|nr:glycosyltransferase [Actinomycetota bacterium]